jgi:uncharacterized protein (DUF1697 family)
MAKPVVAKSGAAGAGRMVALLRGINVGGNKQVPMAELCKLASGLGWRDVTSYIQSGNLVFSCDVPAAAAEAALEKVISRRFGFSVEVVVRSGAAWRRYAAGSPFTDAEAAHPQWLLLGLSKQRPRPDAAEKLRPYATAGERVAVIADGLWIDFTAGVGKSKLTPAVLDRAIGSTVTARNWRTVQKLAEMSEG